MVLRTFLAKVQNMFSQQMKSIDCFKLENGNLHLSLSPSNLVANYNIQHNSMLGNTYNNASSPPDYGRVELLCPLLQRSTVESLLPDYGRLILNCRQ